MGNVVGSNIFNVLLILGLSALAAPLVVHRRIVRIDTPLMLVVSLLAWWMASDGAIVRWEGALLFAGVIAYTVMQVVVGRQEAGASKSKDEPAGPATPVRNVLQVLSNDGTIVYAMFHTIPDLRTTLTDEATVTFRETPAGVPFAVRSLFYGGEYHGYEFVYGKGEPNLIPAVVPQPEITYTAEPMPVIEPPYEPPALQPAAEPVAEPVGEPVPEPAPAELPRTATPLPVIAVGGLASLLAGLGLGVLRRRLW